MIGMSRSKASIIEDGMSAHNFDYLLDKYVIFQAEIDDKKF